jgi:hypothetical protein
MFDSPFDFLSLVIAIVALIFARKAYNQAAKLRERLDVMELVAAPAATSANPGNAVAWHRRTTRKRC